MLKIKIISFFVLMFFVLVISGCREKSEKPDVKQDNVQKQQEQPVTEVKKTDTIKTEDKEETVETKEYVKIETNKGTFKVRLYVKEAPITTKNFIDLVDKGFYNGIIFHRVIDGFMIQGGDPTGTGTGGSDKAIPDEFGPGLKHSKAGILSMANRGPNTGTSQFFITLAPQPHLDGKHAVFGEVVEGMAVVEKIGKAKTGQNDKPIEEIKMVKVEMVEK